MSSYSSTVPTDRRCSYLNCKNNCFSGVFLFNFPGGESEKSIEKKKKWIQNCGNVQLEKYSAKYTRKLKICADHFPPSAFESEFKDKLKNDAIPLPNFYSSRNGNSIESVENNSISNNASLILNEKTVNHNNNEIVSNFLLNETKKNENNEEVPLLTLPFTSYDNLQERCKVLEKENSILSKNNKILQSVVDKLHKKMVVVKRRRFKNPKRLQKYLKTETFNLINKMDLDPVARATVMLQLHTTNTPYLKVERDVAKTLYYHSPAALGSLRQKGAHFPSKNTIRRWLEEFTITPGFCKTVFDKLKQVLMSYPPIDRICCLKFDETVIKSCEQYSEKFDIIEGLVDKGQFGRSPVRAKSVLFLCLDSINVNNKWHQPLAYFFTDKNISGDDLYKIIIECLSRLKKIGADCRFLTCDMGTNNQRLVNLLKIKIKIDQQRSCTNNDVGSFIHDNLKYYIGFDVPHLFKRVLAFLRSRKPLMCDGKVIALYNDFIMAFEVDRKTDGGSHLLSHINERLHLYPNSFESMNVKRTFQMFGRRYAAAMQTAGKANLLIGSKTWIETSKFIERCNDAIDALNTLSNKDEKRLNMKRILSERNPQVENNLIDFLNWTLKWEVPHGSHPDFLNGLPMTISAILNLFNDLKKQFPGFELATGLINQDNVEHLFSKFRQRGGNNANPTARDIRISTGHILSNGYTYKSAGCNSRKPEEECKSLFDIDHNLHNCNIITSSNNESGNMDKNNTNCLDNYESEDWDHEEYDSEDEDDAGVLEDVDTLYGETEKFKENTVIDNNSQNNKYEELDEYAQQAITYFCGFIARRGLQKHDCMTCKNYWLKTPLDPSTSSENYIRIREYTADHHVEDPDVLHLYRPQENLVQIFSLFLKTFNDIWEKFWHFNALLKTIMNECIKSIKNAKKSAGYFNLVQKWFDEVNPCYKHNIYFLQYLLRIKIIARTRLHNQEAKKFNKIKVYKKTNQRLKNLNSV